MVDLSCLSGSKNFLNLLFLGKYKRNFYREHPEYFRPDGLLVFCRCSG